MQIDFTGKLAVVTGGANGIGLAIAKGLAASGASTYILDLERERPAHVAAAFGAHGIVADCSDRTQLVRRSRHRFGLFRSSSARTSLRFAAFTPRCRDCERRYR